MGRETSIRVVFEFCGIELKFRMFFKKKRKMEAVELGQMASSVVSAQSSTRPFIIRLQPKLSQALPKRAARGCSPAQPDLMIKSVEL